MGGAWRLWEDRGIRVGTASWTEKTLIEPGLFYPSGVSSAADRLRFYAERFPLVEVDSTYYALPAERNAVLWAERTPDDFLFNVKAFSLLTRHPTRPTGLPKDLRARLPAAARDKARFYPADVPEDITEEIWTAFLSALAPLEAAGKLGAVLFQFPEWFTPTRANRAYLVECRDRLAAALPGAACAIEFRSAGWMADPERQERSLTLLEDNGLPFVCVDMPQGLDRKSVV